MVKVEDISSVQFLRYITGQAAKKGNLKSCDRNRYCGRVII